MQPLKSAIFAHGTEWYEIANEDTGGDPQYFGYLNLQVAPFNDFIHCRCD